MHNYPFKSQLRRSVFARTENRLTFLTKGNIILFLMFFVITLLFSEKALAHHVADGAAPSNLLEGLVSGLMHPIIELDHLAFMLAVSLLIMMSRTRRLSTPLFLITGMTAGVFLHVFSVDIPYLEFFIIGSVILLGLIVAIRSSFTLYSLIAILFIGGSLHGYAYAESIIGVYGTDSSIFYSYLIGLMIIQYLVALSASLFWLGLSHINTPVIRSTGRAPIYIGLAICFVGIISIATVGGYI